MTNGHEKAQRAAEHKAASLHHLGWELGTGAAVWARTAKDELARHEDARARWGAAETRDRETWERLQGSALAIVVAIEQVLAFEYRVRRITGDATLARARAAFDAIAPDAEALRDLIAHQESYAVGEGWRQKGRPEPGSSPITDPYLATFIFWGNGGSTMLNLGPEYVTLRAAVDAASKLAQVVERVRVEHLERAERDANAALRRRYNLDPE
jgi:hypothetical protein